MTSKIVLGVLLVMVTLSGLAAKADAQEIKGCTVATLADPPRQVFTCANGVVIEAEAAAAIEAVAPQSGAAAGTVSLTGKAALIEVAPGGSGFQILTPNAIASVRGTRFVVDVAADKTSVFVIEGKVEVTRKDGEDGVMLAPGDGVDVTAGAPLTVRQWPKARVSALLARFAQ